MFINKLKSIKRKCIKYSEIKIKKYKVWKKLYV